MIRYALRCAEGHSFDSWFKSAADFDTLAGRDLVSCAVCGATEVDKVPMAPALGGEERTPRKADRPRPLSAPGSDAEKALAELRRKVEDSSEYVGRDFAREARAIHDGASQKRAIHGEAKLEEARALIEDGVPVAPLPFRPRRQTN